MFGRHEEKCNDYWNVPIDRIVKMDELDNVKFKNRPDNYMKYFDDFIGVSEKVWKGENGDENDIIFQNGIDKAPKRISITLRIDDQGTWGRMITKRLHWSQVPLDNGFCNGCGRLKIEIIPNVEFYNKLMELGENVVVESPIKVREIIKERLQDTLKKYE